MRKNKRAIGTTYEKTAGAYLTEQGCEVLAYNFFCRSGEIDIIAKDGEYLVFCEVRYRSHDRDGHPLETISLAKQRKISQSAQYYLYKYGIECPCRFDVIGICDEEITWIQNAFPYRNMA